MSEREAQVTLAQSCGACKTWTWCSQFGFCLSESTPEEHPELAALRASAPAGETQADPVRLLHDENPPSPWRPEQDLIRLAVLGKLSEELAEAGAIVARCLIQGIDESEPVTRQHNSAALANELADVRATSEMAVNLFGLDGATMQARTDRKQRHLQRWHEMIREMPALPALAPLERLVERLKRFADSLEERQHLHPCLPAYTKAARLYADELASVLASLQKEQP